MLQKDSNKVNTLATAKKKVGRLKKVITDKRTSSPVRRPARLQ